MIESHQHFDINNKIIIEKVIVRHPMRRPSPLSDEACLMYNLTGKSNIYAPEQKETVSAKECVLLKCGQYFTATAPSEQEEPIEAVAVHFYPAILKMAFQDDLSKYIPTQVEEEAPTRAINRVNVDKLLKGYIDSILFLFEYPSMVTEELILLKVKEAILLLLNTDSDEADKIRQILSNLFSPSRVSLRKVVDAHIYDNLTLEELATLCNMSLSTFKRKFQGHFGESPAGYVRKKKLEKAALMLKKTEEPVSVICYESGFSDTSNFTKTFKGQFSCTPLEYRKLHKLN
ncbi:MAG: AraC family transcriptional regulator [Bacteroidota bacterium]